MRASAARIRVALGHLVERGLLGRAMPNGPILGNAVFLLPGHALHLLSRLKQKGFYRIGVTCANEGENR